MDSAIHDIMAMDVQMVVLGTGDWNFEEAFRHAQAQYPGRFSANILYSGALSTAIYGGADLFRASQRHRARQRLYLR